jgi:AAA-like domain/CHAT domain
MSIEMNDNSVTKILILAANPIDSVKLSLEREINEIRTTLQLSASRDRFTIEPRGAVRPNDLQQYMYDVKPQIVHFSGHGIGSEATSDDLSSSRKLKVIDDDAQPEGLMFEDDNGRSKLVSGAVLAELFGLFKESVNCVVLNSCYSVAQAKEIVKYIPYVVCMNRAIGDIAARKFSQGFYRAIWDDRSIEEAFTSGKNAIGLNAIPEALTPVLLTRSIDNLDLRPPIALNLEEPEGAVKLNSAFYIDRPPVEERCEKSIETKGALIKIKASRQMGKSSLMIRLRHRAIQLGYKAVNLDFERADKSSFEDLNKFLRWFCASISKGLGLPIEFAEYWHDDLFSSKDNCTEYFESYLLKTIASPIVLTLDKVDILFGCPIANEFFSLLRVWHEEATRELIWENLRLIVAHSQDPKPSNFNINQSPFGNVGVPIELLEFNRSQVKDLATRHGLQWSDLELEELMQMVGGHPYLVRVALYQTASQYIDFRELLEKAPTEAGIYGDHLRRLFQQLKSNNLVAAMQQVVASENPERLLLEETSLLDDLGLISLQKNDAIASCNLYRLYFRDRLRGL